jgi:AGCS family alanine or glycine:cation symporter
VAYYYIAETNISYINRFIARPWMTQVLRVGIIAAVVYGTVKTADLAWGLGDIGVGLMAWLNIAAILMMQKPAFICLKDYEEQKARGIDPQFNPEALNIKGADYWVERHSEKSTANRGDLS